MGFYTTLASGCPDGSGFQGRIVVKLIDLHTHTLASDGTDSPAELVAKAREAGLAAVAVTDHDTVAGLEQACEAGRALGIDVIRGCELSTNSEHGELHILGLFLPEDSGPLADVLLELRARRSKRNEKIVDKLRALGMDISKDEVREQARGESVGRPHIASVMLRRGHVSCVQEAFKRYLGYNGKAYLPKEVLHPREAVRALVEAGATVCLAHPMLRKYPSGWLQAFTAKLVDYGLTAIEVWHSEHSEADVRACLSLARRFNLGVSGGSDYHGANKPGIALGKGYGKLRVGIDVLENLLQRRAALGL
jgi:predicted metal-dependent phosphoesterase TrpH